ncbi:polyribonucleotide nucleotidyltransferase [bacterium]|nr:polyribonucleotide nucleotidyltransferase [bacterium]
MNFKKFQTEIGGKKLQVEIKNLAQRAASDVLVSYGETTVLATTVISDKEKEGIDFFPLTVDYEERYYAAGKILGSRYIRREGRPSEEAIITARLIDRAIRPLFPEYLRKEVQVVVTCLSWDGENDPDIPALIATSLALSISEIPWSGPIAGARISTLNNEFIINPNYNQREKSELDLVFTGLPDTKKERFLINMIEAGTKEVKEEVILKAVDFLIPELEKILDFQNKIIKEVGKKKIILNPPSKDIELEKEIKTFLKGKIEKAIYQPEEKNLKKIQTLKEELVNFIEEKYPEKEKTKIALELLNEEIKKLVHFNIIKKEERPDGRKLDEVRKIYCEAGLLPRTHGSGLFCRGETKSLSILTLGAPGDQKLLEGMEIIGKKRFMHHYNFPPYSVGEIRPIRGPGRREIGHGMLAEKALKPLIPDTEEFPYTIRIVSEILSSNGSTSMASVSSSSLALMDAGVPIKRPAAGIAIGLMEDEESGNYKLLTDIQGPEDHHGDMDLKVAGTKKGITAIQMDVKIRGITKEILKEALERAKQARWQILEEIEKVLPHPRPKLSPFAPVIYTIQIKPEKIREVIGPGGRVIHEIIEKCNVLAIDIEETGKVYVTAEKEEFAKKAVEWIKNITKEVKVGEVFQGTVTRIVDFGAFVEIFPKQEGLIHISQLSPKKIKRVEEVVKVGDVIPVKVISIDEQGRINLSLKEVKNKSFLSKNKSFLWQKKKRKKNF